MKTKLFGKTAALVMGSLMIVSGQTLAMEANKQEVTNAEALGEFELLIAQNGVDPESKKVAVDVATLAQSDLGNALAETKAKVKASRGKDLAVNLLTAASTLVGNATSGT